LDNVPLADLLRDRERVGRPQGEQVDLHMQMDPDNRQQHIRVEAELGNAAEDGEEAGNRDQRDRLPPRDPEENAMLNDFGRIMAEAITNAVNRQPNRESIPVPVFDGEGDVELFIRQFREVARVARWAPDMTVLKLRHALQGKAQPCGTGATVEAILGHLQLRFGLTASEARSRLAVLRRPTGVSLAEHASQVTKLVEVGYATVPLDVRRQLVADNFRRSTGHDGLHRHLLAVASENVEDLVRQGNAYLQTFGSRGDRTYAVQSVDQGATSKPEKSELTALKEVVESLQKQLAVMEKSLAASNASRSQATGVTKAKVQNNQAKKGDDKKPFRCYGCGQIGHVRRQCRRGWF
jgi:hypothetical protein